MLDTTNHAHLPPSSWTDEKVAMLKKMHADGTEYPLIGAALGMTRHAVAGKAFRLGLPKREVSQSPRRSRGGQGRADRDRSTTMRIKKLRVRGPANGGAQIVECVVREPDPEIAEFNAAVPIGQRCTLLELTDETCHFPIGEVGDPGFFFCGAAIPEGSIYCGYHARVCYQPLVRPAPRPYLPTGGSKLRVF